MENPAVGALDAIGADAAEEQTSKSPEEVPAECRDLASCQKEAHKGQTKLSSALEASRKQSAKT